MERQAKIGCVSSKYDITFKLKKQLIYLLSVLVVYSAKQRQTWIYVWMENEAGFGTEEIGSVLRRHLLREMFSVKEVAIYSDSKPSHKSLRMCLLLKSLVEENCTIETIKMRYIYHEHTELPTDVDLAYVERATSKKQDNLYTDEQYVDQLQTNSAKRRAHHIIQRMEPWQFYTSMTIEQFFPNHNVTMTGVHVDWTSLREIRLNVREPNLVYVKPAYHIGEDYLTINLSHGEPSASALPFGFSWCRELSKLWLYGRRITKQKWTDLMSMFGVIPVEYQHMYTKLKVINDCDDCHPDRDQTLTDNAEMDNILRQQQQQQYQHQHQHQQHQLQQYQQQHPQPEIMLPEHVVGYPPDLDQFNALSNVQCIVQPYHHQPSESIAFPRW